VVSVAVVSLTPGDGPGTQRIGDYVGPTNCLDQPRQTGGQFEFFWWPAELKMYTYGHKTTIYVQKRRLDKNLKSDIKLLIESSYLRVFSRWPYGSKDRLARASFMTTPLLRWVKNMLDRRQNSLRELQTAVNREIQREVLGCVCCHRHYQ
jgi:hypothetical protein